LDPGGPKRTGCSVTQEFVTPYFTCPAKETLQEEMELLYSQEVQSPTFTCQTKETLQEEMELFHSNEVPVYVDF
jgi:hypothetical protein